ncbi:MAG: putative molybdopterin biosynthesis protein [Archaeoglobaceae archaeon]|nr:putative molybdopterin biosynthesis protein [Archaeoglobaceae archaeon]
MEELTTRYEILIEYRGEKIVDSAVARILKALDEKKSLISASKSLGISYARLWNIIARIERVTGEKIVEAKKGGKSGGGAELTDFGRRILNAYERANAKLEQLGLIGKMQKLSDEPEIVIAHSHDPVFSAIIERLSENFSVKSLCVGSGMALAMLTLGEVDVACAHLYDQSGYNIAYLEKLWLKERVEKIGEFQRELVVAYRKDMDFDSFDELIAEILRGKLRVANRNRGSGTRLYFDLILSKYAEKLNLNFERISGYETEFYTHEEVARQIYGGNFDAGAVLRYFAEKYNLKFFHLTWETYECYSLKDRKKDAIDCLRDSMKSEWLRSLIHLTPGYRYTIR